MSVSFKKPPQKYILRRDGRVEHRAKGHLIGRVFRMGPMHGHGWQWTDHRGEPSPLIFGYDTREQAIRALVHRADVEVGRLHDE